MSISRPRITASARVAVWGLPILSRPISRGSNQSRVADRQDAVAAADKQVYGLPGVVGASCVHRYGRAAVAGAKGGLVADAACGAGD